jgi:hypothetical protein
MSTARQASPGPDSAGKRWGPIARTLVSLVLVWHLVAILLGPLSMPPSLLADQLGRWFRPYTEATFLDHAYKFFAPDPGPTHLVRYDLEMADGSHRTGEFPNLKEHWPRLLYHRHFMLSEFMGNAPPPEGWENQPWDKQPLLPWQTEYARSFAEHLLAESGAQRVTLQLVRHAMPYPQQVIDGAKLTHPDSYQVRALGSFVRETR